MISVLIPLGTGSKVDNWELRYTLRSIEQNFDFDYNITIYSETELDWVSNVTVKKIPRFYPEHLLKRWNGTKHYENYYDTLNKLFLASTDEDLSEEVLYVYDDVLLLKKQDLGQIKTLYAGGRFSDNKDYWLNPKGNKWRNTIFQAIDRAREFTADPYLYETHLPRVYHKSKLKEMFKKHPIKSLEIPFAPATLYFNMFYQKPDCNYKKDKESKNNDIKAGFYGTPNTICDVFPSKHMADVLNAVQGKLWVNYNDSGLQPPLKLWIEQSFPQKSKYEK